MWEEREINDVYITGIIVDGDLHNVTMSAFHEVVDRLCQKVPQDGNRHVVELALYDTGAHSFMEFKFLLTDDMLYSVSGDCVTFVPQYSKIVEQLKCYEAIKEL